MSTLMRTFFGVGCLAIPYLFLQGGILLTTALLIIISIISIYGIFKTVELSDIIMMAEIRQNMVTRLKRQHAAQLQQALVDKTQPSDGDSSNDLDTTTTTTTTTSATTTTTTTTPAPPTPQPSPQQQQSFSHITAKPFEIYLTATDADILPIDRENVTQPTLSEIGTCAFGPLGGLLTTLATLICQFGCVVAYIIFISINVAEVLHISRYLIMFILLIPIMSLNMLPDMKTLSPVGVIGNIIYLCTIGFIFYVGFDEYCCIENDQIHLVDLSSFPLVFGILSFTLEGIILTLPIRNKMRRQSQFYSTMASSMVLIVSLYWFIGYVSYILYGAATSSPIIASLPESNAVGKVIKITLSLAILFTIPFQFYPITEFINRSLTTWLRLDKDSIQLSMEYINHHQTQVELRGQGSHRDVFNINGHGNDGNNNNTDNMGRQLDNNDDDDVQVQNGYHNHPNDYTNPRPQPNNKQPPHRPSNSISPHTQPQTATSPLLHDGESINVHDTFPTTNTAHQHHIIIDPPSTAIHSTLHPFVDPPTILAQYTDPAGNTIYTPMSPPFTSLADILHQKILHYRYSIALRHTVVIFATIIAAVFPDFHLILSLFGSLASSSVAYIFPCFFWLAIVSKGTWILRSKDAFARQIMGNGMDYNTFIAWKLQVMKFKRQFEEKQASFRKQRRDQLAAIHQSRRPSMWAYTKAWVLSSCFGYRTDAFHADPSVDYSGVTRHSSGEYDEQYGGSNQYTHNTEDNYPHYLFHRDGAQNTNTVINTDDTNSPRHAQMNNDNNNNNSFITAHNSIDDYFETPTTSNKIVSSNPSSPTKPLSLNDHPSDQFYDVGTQPRFNTNTSANNGGKSMTLSNNNSFECDVKGDNDVNLFLPTPTTLTTTTATTKTPTKPLSVPRQQRQLGYGNEYYNNQDIGAGQGYEYSQLGTNNIDAINNINVYNAHNPDPNLHHSSYHQNIDENTIIIPRFMHFPIEHVFPYTRHGEPIDIRTILADNNAMVIQQHLYFPHSQLYSTRYGDYHVQKTMTSDSFEYFQFDHLQQIQHNQPQRHQQQLEQSQNDGQRFDRDQPEDGLEMPQYARTQTVDGVVTNVNNSPHEHPLFRFDGSQFGTQQPPPSSITSAQLPQQQQQQQNDDIDSDDYKDDEEGVPIAAATSSLQKQRLNSQQHKKYPSGKQHSPESLQQSLLSSDHINYNTDKPFLTNNDDDQPQQQQSLFKPQQQHLSVQNQTHQSRQQPTTTQSNDLIPSQPPNSLTTATTTSTLSHISYPNPYTTNSTINPNIANDNTNMQGAGNFQRQLSQFNTSTHPQSISTHPSVSSSILTPIGYDDNDTYSDPSLEHIGYHKHLSETIPPKQFTLGQMALSVVFPAIVITFGVTSSAMGVIDSVFSLIDHFFL